MELLYQSPQNWLLACVLVSMAFASAWFGTKNFTTGIRYPDRPDQTLRVVRGIRGGIIAIALTSIAAGLLSTTTWPVIFGLVFLGEELLETGIMVLALRGELSTEREK